MMDAVDCRSRAKVRASAWLSDKSVSSGVSPLAKDFDQIRRADAGDQGRVAFDSHCLKGAGSLSNAAIGSSDRRLRRKLLCPKFRLMCFRPDHGPGRAPEQAGFHPCLRLGASDAIAQSLALRARAFRGEVWESPFGR